MTNNPWSFYIFHIRNYKYVCCFWPNCESKLEKARGKICYNRCLAKIICAVPHTTRFGYIETPSGGKIRNVKN